MNASETPMNTAPVSTPIDVEDVAIPDGFDTFAGRVMGDGWMKKEKGNVCQGRLLGRNEMDDGERAFYQVQLDKDCKAITGKGDDTKEVILKKGSIVNIDESKALHDMRKYAKNLQWGGVYDVWILYGEKQKLDGGNTFWPIINGPRLKQVKAPKIPKDDTPF
jgi:hypothetical protein